MLRSAFSGGPAFFNHDSVVWQFVDDEWSASHEIKDTPINTNLQGRVGSREDYSESIVQGTPLAFTAQLATQFAKLFKFGGKVGIVEGLRRGKLLFPSSDLPGVIQTTNGGESDAGQSITFSAVAAQQPPELSFGGNMPLFGQVTWQGLRKNDTAATDAAAHVVVADSAFTEPSFSPGAIVNTTYSMSWGASGSPFTDIECDESGVKVKITYSWQEIGEWNNGIIQARLTDVQVEIRFTPLNLDAANLFNTFLLMDGASAGRGAIMAARGQTLTIAGASSGDPRLIIPCAVVKSAPTRFGGNSRIGEVVLSADYGFSSTQAGTTVNADATVTVPSTASLRAGLAVSGTGIPNGATILSITNETTFELSANATADGAGVTLTFTGMHPLFALGVVP